MSDLLILASGTGSQAENPLLCDDGLGAVEDRDYTPSTSVDRTCRKPLTNKGGRSSQERRRPSSGQSGSYQHNQSRRE